MNSKHYDAWKKSHQIAASEVDISDAVMEQLTRKACRHSSLKSSLGMLLLNRIQARVCVRICVIVAGALAGLLRSMFVVYYALFA